MNICKDCGKTHGMVVKNMITGHCEPIDLCYDCLFKGCMYVAPKAKIELDPGEDYGSILRSIEDKLIREMILSSAATFDPETVTGVEPT